MFIGNLGPLAIKRQHGRFYVFKWPHKTRALALIADISLSLFLVMSLLSMQVETILVNFPIITMVILSQFIVVVLYIYFVVFPAMGKNYDAAVISAGFTGISLGATPTAMINMSGVAKRYGASHMAFIVIPLVSALFIDVINFTVVSGFLSFS